MITPVLALLVACSSESTGPSRFLAAKIDFPVEGDDAEEGDLIAARGRVGHREREPTALLTWWYLGEDLACDSVRPDERGNTSCDLAMGSADADVRLVVIDPNRHEAEDSVQVAFDGDRAPWAIVVEPEAGAYGDTSHDVTLLALVGDDVDDPGALAVTWESDIDGVLDTSAEVEESGWLAGSVRLSEGNHLLTLRVEDSAAQTAEVTTTIAVAWYPVEPLLSLESPDDGSVWSEPEGVRTELWVVDDEDPPEDLTVTWTSDVDGTLAITAPSPEGVSTVSLFGLSVGEHLLTATVTDTDGNSGSVEANITINGAPTAPEVEITPAVPDTDDTLTAAVTVDSVDPEGDAVAYSYEWYLEGDTTPSSTKETLSASKTSRGEKWRVEVVPSDAYGEGDAGVAEVVIGNADPEVVSLSFDPSDPVTGTLLAVDYRAVDPDDDTLSASYAWTVDGVAVSPVTSTLDGATWFDRGQVVGLTFTVSDAYGGAASDSISVTVGNTPPEPPVVAISPSSPEPGVDDLVCAVVTEGTDADGDALTYSFSWEMNYAAWTGDVETTTWPDDTIPGTETARSETWTCLAVASDGTDTSDEASDSVESGSCDAPGSTSIALASASLVGEDASDRAGHAITSIGDVDGDGVGDLGVGAFGADDAGSAAGRVYIALGPSSGDLGSARAVLDGEAASDNAGIALAAAGDYDGDGIGDLLVGSYQGKAPKRGVAWVVSGTTTGTASLSTATLRITGAARDDQAGRVVGGAGDTDADGYADVLVASTAVGIGGAAYLVGGPLSGSLDLATHTDLIVGASASEVVGYAAGSAGDSDGDGYDDVLVSADEYTYLFRGPLSGTVTTAGATWAAAVEKATALVPVGDLDGDGLEDIAIGAPTADGLGSVAGSAWVLLGATTASGSVGDLAWAAILGENDGDEVGAMLALSADIDGDGWSDLLVGAPGDDTAASDAGGVYLFSAIEAGAWKVSCGERMIYGTSASGLVGGALAGPGDVDADGVPDLAIGDSTADDAATDAGALRILSGSGL